MNRAKGFGNPKESEESENKLTIEAGVVPSSGKPFVILEWGEESTRLTVAEAIDHANSLVKLAISALAAAKLYEWATLQIGSSPQDAASLLHLFGASVESNQFDYDVPTDQGGGKPTKPEDVRATACQIIEATFLAQSEVFLEWFVREELHMGEEAVSSLMEEYRQMRGVETLEEVS